MKKLQKVISTIVLLVLIFSCNIGFLDSANVDHEGGDVVEDFDFQVTKSLDGNFEVFNGNGISIEDDGITNFIKSVESEFGLDSSLNDSPIYIYDENPSIARSGQQDDCEHSWGSMHHSDYNHIHWFMKACHVDKYWAYCNWCGKKKNYSSA